MRWTLVDRGDSKTEQWLRIEMNGATLYFDLREAKQLANVLEGFIVDQEERAKGRSRPSR